MTLYRGVPAWHPSWREIRNGAVLPLDGNPTPDFPAHDTSFIPFKTDLKAAQSAAAAFQGLNPGEELRFVEGYDPSDQDFPVGAVVTTTLSATGGTPVVLVDSTTARVGGPIVEFTDIVFTMGTPAANVLPSDDNHDHDEFDGVLGSSMPAVPNAAEIEDYLATYGALLADPRTAPSKGKGRAGTHIETAAPELEESREDGESRPQVQATAGPEQDTTPTPAAHGPRHRYFSQVVADHQKWLFVVNPLHHRRALSAYPANPGSLYEHERSPGFQYTMLAAFGSMLDGDGLRVDELEWRKYVELHALATSWTAESIEVSGTHGRTRFGMQMPAPAADLFDERVLGRRLNVTAESGQAAIDAGEQGALTLFQEIDGTPMVFTQYLPEDAPALANALFDGFRTAVNSALDDSGRLRAIGQLIRQLHVLHFFTDGNGRLNIFLLLPCLLLEYGFRPVVHPRLDMLFSGGFSLDEIVDALQSAQEVDLDEYLASLAAQVDADPDSIATPGFLTPAPVQSTPGTGRNYAEIFAELRPWNFPNRKAWNAAWDARLRKALNDLNELPAAEAEALRTDAYLVTAIDGARLSEVDPDETVEASALRARLHGLIALVSLQLQEDKDADVDPEVRKQAAFDLFNWVMIDRGVASWGVPLPGRRGDQLNIPDDAHSDAAISEALVITSGIELVFKVKVHSAQGAQIQREAHPDAPPINFNAVQPRPWDLDELRGVWAALGHFAPLLGARRAVSSRGHEEQEIQSVSAVTFSLGADGIDHTAAGEYFDRAGNFSLYPSGGGTEFGEGVRGIEAVATREIARGLLGYAQTAFTSSVDTWGANGRPRLVEDAEEPLPGALTAEEDFILSIHAARSELDIDKDRFAQQSPKHAEAIGKLSEMYPDVLDSDKDAEHVAEVLREHLPEFNLAVGAWTADGWPNFKGERPITQYGADNPAADLAEAAMYYFLAPQELRERAPQRAAFLGKLVQGWSLDDTSAPTPGNIVASGGVAPRPSDVSEVAAAVALMRDAKARGFARVRLSAGTATPTDKVALNAFDHIGRMWPKRGPVLDLRAVHSAIDSGPDSSLVWMAALAYLASLEDARGKIKIVVDRYRDGGQWKHVALPDAARDRFTVTGKGEWHSTGLMFRPVRLVPPGAVALRVDLDRFRPPLVSIEFADKQKTLDEGEWQVDRFARWLAEAAVELDGDGLPPLIAEFSGQGHGRRYRAPATSWLDSGTRRAAEVRSRVLQGVTAELTRLESAARAGVLSAETIVPANRITGTRNPNRGARNVVTATAFPAANLTVPTTTSLGAVFAGVDKKGARRYFTAGQVQMRTLTDASGQIMGVTFDAPGGDPTLMSEGFPVNNDRRVGLLMADEMMQDTVPPISMAFPWDGDNRTFFVDTHGKPGFAMITLADGTLMFVTGGTLARLVLGSEAFRQVGGALVDSFALYICDAGAPEPGVPNGKSVAEDFWRTVTESRITAAVDGASKRLWVAHKRNDKGQIEHKTTGITQGGYWVSFGRDAAGLEITADEVLKQVPYWRKLPKDAQKHYAELIPLFAVVDKVYRASDLLKRGLLEKGGVLNLAAVRGLVEAPPVAGARAVRTDLVWETAIKLVRSGPHTGLLGGVVVPPDLMHLMSGHGFVAGDEVEWADGRMVRPARWSEPLSTSSEGVTESNVGVAPGLNRSLVDMFNTLRDRTHGVGQRPVAAGTLYDAVYRALTVGEASTSPGGLRDAVLSTVLALLADRQDGESGARSLRANLLAARITGGQLVDAVAQHRAVAEAGEQAVRARDFAGRLIATHLRRNLVITTDSTEVVLRPFGGPATDPDVHIEQRADDPVTYGPAVTPKPAVSPIDQSTALVLSNSPNADGAMVDVAMVDAAPGVMAVDEVATDAEVLHADEASFGSGARTTPDTSDHAFGPPRAVANAAVNELVGAAADGFATTRQHEELLLDSNTDSNTDSDTDSNRALQVSPPGARGAAGSLPRYSVVDPGLADPVPPLYTAEPVVLSTLLRDQHGRVVGVSFMSGAELARAQEWARSSDLDASTMVDTDYVTLAAMAPEERARHLRSVRGPWTQPRPGAFLKPFFVDVHGDGEMVSVSYSDGTTGQLTGRQFAGVLKGIDVFMQAGWQAVALLSCAVGPNRGAATFAFDLHDGLQDVRMVIVHAPTGQIVPVGDTYELDELRNTTAIFDGGGWVTVDHDRVWTRTVMARMRSHPPYAGRGADVGTDKWFDNIANLANRIVAVLENSIRESGTLDLVGARRAVIDDGDSAPRTMWSAALSVVAGGPWASQVSTVVDLSNDGGYWGALSLEPQARSCYVVTGKGIWDRENGRVSRPARMVRPGEFGVTRSVDPADPPLVETFEFAQGETRIDYKSESGNRRLQGVHRLARWLAQAAIEDHIDGRNPAVVVEITGYGRQGELAGAGRGEQAGLARAEFVAKLLHREVEHRLRELAEPVLARRLLIRVPRLVPKPTGAHLTDGHEQPFVQVQVRAKGMHLDSSPAVSVTAEAPPGARHLNDTLDDDRLGDDRLGDDRLGDDAGPIPEVGLGTGAQIVEQQAQGSVVLGEDATTLGSVDARPVQQPPFPEPSRGMGRAGSHIDTTTPESQESAEASEAGPQVPAMAGTYQDTALQDVDLDDYLAGLAAQTGADPDSGSGKDSELDLGLPALVRSTADTGGKYDSIFSDLRPVNFPDRETWDARLQQALRELGSMPASEVDALRIATHTATGIDRAALSEVTFDSSVVSVSNESLVETFTALLDRTDKALQGPVAAGTLYDAVHRALPEGEASKNAGDLRDSVLFTARELRDDSQGEQDEEDLVALWLEHLMTARITGEQLVDAVAQHRAAALAGEQAVRARDFAGRLIATYLGRNLVITAGGTQIVLEPLDGPATDPGVAIEQRADGTYGPAVTPKPAVLPIDESSATTPSNSPNAGAGSTRKHGRQDGVHLTSSGRMPAGGRSVVQPVVTHVPSMAPSVAFAVGGVEAEPGSSDRPGIDELPPASGTRSTADFGPRPDTLGLASTTALSEVDEPPGTAESSPTLAVVPVTSSADLDMYRSKAPVNQVRLRTYRGPVVFEVRRVEVRPGVWVRELTLVVYMNFRQGQEEAARDAFWSVLQSGVERMFNRGLVLPSGDHLRVQVITVAHERTAGVSVDVDDPSALRPVERTSWHTGLTPAALAEAVADLLGAFDPKKVTARVTKEQLESLEDTSRTGGLRGLAHADLPDLASGRWLAGEDSVGRTRTFTSGQVLTIPVTRNGRDVGVLFTNTGGLHAWVSRRDRANALFMVDATGTRRMPVVLRGLDDDTTRVIAFHGQNAMGELYVFGIGEVQVKPSVFVNVVVDTGVLEGVPDGSLVVLAACSISGLPDGRGFMHAVQPLFAERGLDVRVAGGTQKVVPASLRSNGDTWLDVIDGGHVNVAGPTTEADDDLVVAELVAAAQSGWQYIKTRGGRQYHANFRLADRADTLALAVRIVGSLRGLAVRRGGDLDLVAAYSWASTTHERPDLVLAVVLSLVAADRSFPEVRTLTNRKLPPERPRMAGSRQWTKVPLAPLARSRFMVTGKSTWDYEAGEVRRPVRLVPLGESAPLRAGVDTPLQVEAQFHLLTNQVVQRQELEDFARTAAEIAFENHEDGIALPTIQIVGYAGMGLAVRDESRVRDKAIERANRVAAYLRRFVGQHLAALTPDGEQVLSPDLIVTSTVSGIAPPDSTSRMQAAKATVYLISPSGMSAGGRSVVQPVVTHVPSMAPSAGLVVGGVEAGLGSFDLLGSGGLPERSVLDAESVRYSTASTAEWMEPDRPLHVSQWEHLRYRAVPAVIRTAPFSISEQSVIVPSTEPGGRPRILIGPAFKEMKAAFELRRMEVVPG
ncbi:hypothetical protein ABZX92_43150, partial [Lentzea sp. NPDC006480]|uniref:hypothetical protein n=1 Tax=Lentzea sp. NPDC006480 TaxID=3157176 RepID=UPI0033A0EFE3